VVKLELEGLGIHGINNVQAMMLFNIGDTEMTVGELTLRGCYAGMMATTRLSTAATVQAVQPRFEAPATTNLSTVMPPLSGFAQIDVIASIARTTLFVIGKRIGLLGAEPCCRGG